MHTKLEYETQGIHKAYMRSPYVSGLYDLLLLEIDVRLENLLWFDYNSTPAFSERPFSDFEVIISPYPLCQSFNSDVVWLLIIDLNIVDFVNTIWNLDDTETPPSFLGWTIITSRVTKQSVLGTPITWVSDSRSIPREPYRFKRWHFTAYFLAKPKEMNNCST